MIVDTDVRPGEGRPRATDLLLASVLVAATLLWAYYSTLQLLIQHWRTNDMYSYGFLVPVISAYVAWARRHRLRALRAAPSCALGAATLGGALLMLVVGRTSNTNVIQELSLPIAVTGATLLVAGAAVTRTLFFPLAYLFAMVPFWDFLTDPLQKPFQLYSAVMGVGALRLFDLPVLRDGVFIYLPDITLEVADVCSGVNQLVAILCIGVPLAYMHISGWSKRLIVVAAAVIIAVLSNGVRVAMICLFAYHGIKGPGGDVHGPYQLLRTTLISGIGFLMLFWLIGRFADRVDGGDASPMEPALQPRRVHRPGVAIAVLLLASAAGFELWHRVQPVPLAADLKTFPPTIGQWQVVADRQFSATVDAVGFDEKLSRRYAAPDGSEIDMLFGYFVRQAQGRELVGFEVSRLLSASETPLAATLDSGARVNDFVTVVDGDAYHVTYCYILGSRIEVDGRMAKIRSTWDALTRRRNNGGILVIRTRLRDGSSGADARARAHEFMTGALARYSRYLPS